MSGSPKYNCYQLQAEQERQLLATRTAFAKEEEAARRREIEARKAARLEASKGELEERLDRAAARIQGAPAHIRIYAAPELAQTCERLQLTSRQIVTIEF